MWREEGASGTLTDVNEPNTHRQKTSLDLFGPSKIYPDYSAGCASPRLMNVTRKHTAQSTASVCPKALPLYDG